MPEIEDLVGERLMIGLAGPTLSDADVRLFSDTRAAGLILYRRNFESPAQLLALLTRLEEALGRRLLVATDHEGGRVVMLGRGGTIFPVHPADGTAGGGTFAAGHGPRGRSRGGPRPARRAGGRRPARPPPARGPRGARRGRAAGARARGRAAGVGGRDARGDAAPGGGGRAAAGR